MPSKRQKECGDKKNAETKRMRRQKDADKERSLRFFVGYFFNKKVFFFYLSLIRKVITCHSHDFLEGFFVALKITSQFDFVKRLKIP